MRLIDADALIEFIVEEAQDLRTLSTKTVGQAISKTPTIDAVPVRHGKWVGAESQCAIGCPFCGTPVDDFCVSIDYIELLYEPNYCPNCGAKMDEERKEE